MYITKKEFSALEQLQHWTAEYQLLQKPDHETVVLFVGLDAIIARYIKEHRKINEKQKKLMREKRRTNPKYGRVKK